MSLVPWSRIHCLRIFSFQCLLLNEFALHHTLRTSIADHSVLSKLAANISYMICENICVLGFGTFETLYRVWLALWHHRLRIHANLDHDHSFYACLHRPFGRLPKQHQSTIRTLSLFAILLQDVELAVPNIPSTTDIILVHDCIRPANPSPRLGTFCLDAVKYRARFPDRWNDYTWV